MRFLSSTDARFAQVVAIDASFKIFGRAWCVAELAAASIMGMRQQLKFRSADSLTRNEGRLRELRIEDMQASRPEDKEAILSRIPDPAAFNTELQALLFEDLLPAWRAIDAMEQMQRLARVSCWQRLAERRGTIGLWSFS